jgi:hypothetical protein
MKQFRKRSCITLAILLASLLAVPITRADDDSKEKAKAAFETIKRLEGTWVKEAAAGNEAMSTVFHTTAGGSVVLETMAPGTKYEMVNAYHMDGDKLMVTHYCAAGNQPSMAMSNSEDNHMTFDFASCSNLKEGEGCMGGLEMKIDGDKLTENWFFRKDGKLGQPDSFEFHRKK